jgi:hypothetical protein
VIAVTVKVVLPLSLTTMMAGEVEPTGVLPNAKFPVRRITRVAVAGEEAVGEDDDPLSQSEMHTATMRTQRTRFI